MADRVQREAWIEEERRRSPRKRLTGEAWLQCAGREYILVARDVSESGIGAATDRESPPASEGTISFRLRPGDLPIACRCRVVYSVEGKGLGVEFFDVSEECRVALKNFVDPAN